MSKLLTKEAILAASDMPSAEVDVPEWGGTVRIRQITAGERDLFEQDILARQAEGKTVENIRAYIIALCIVDESGQRLFTTPEDVKALGAKGIRGVQRVYEAVMQSNALTVRDVEELRKN